MAVIYGCYLCYDKKQRCSAAHSLSRCATVKGGISMKKAFAALAAVLFILSGIAGTAMAADDSAAASQQDPAYCDGPYGDGSTCWRDGSGSAYQGGGCRGPRGYRGHYGGGCRW